MKSFQIRLAVILIWLVGCAHYPLNQPVTDLGDLESYNSRLNIRGENRSDDLILILAFSGGGTRAASLSYGVLRELQGVQIGATNADGSARTLLDEVDVISSVSGGSFTASYFGLKGSSGFPEFEKNFLYRNVERALLWRLLSPVNWWRLGSTKFGRSEMAAEYYDKILFKGAGLGEMLDRPEAPRIAIQATDIANGNQFGFSKTSFGVLCSDYRTFPVSRAVTASSSFPGAFSSVTLRNYADRCSFGFQGALEAIENEGEKSGRLLRLATDVLRYRNVEATPFVHLQDGGIADNLGIRGPLNTARFQIAEARRNPHQGGKFPKNVAFIIVDAETSSEGFFSKFDATPSLYAMLWETFSIFISNYNVETLELLKASFVEWEKLSRSGAMGERPIRFNTIHVSFRDIAEKKRRKKFLAMPTTLGLPDKDVDALVAVGGELMRASPGFKSLVLDLGGKMPESR